MRTGVRRAGKVCSLGCGRLPYCSPGELTAAPLYAGLMTSLRSVMAPDPLTAAERPPAEEVHCQQRCHTCCSSLP